MMNKSRSAVRRYLKELSQKRYIKIVPRYDSENTQWRGARSTTRPRGQTSNSYTLLDQPDLIAAAKQILQEWYAKQKRTSG